MGNVIDINTATKRELTSKFTQYKMDKYECAMRKAGDDTTVLELTGIGELLQAIIGGTSAGALGIDTRIVRILSTHRMITLIELGNASYSREEATQKLEKYLEEDDHSILTAYFDLLIEIDMDLKIFRTFGLDVKQVKGMFKKAKNSMGRMIMNSKAFSEGDETESQSAETDETVNDGENNAEVTETENTETVGTVDINSAEVGSFGV